MDLVLSHEIEQNKHKASVKDGTLNITLFKKNDIAWETLQYVGDKKEVAELRKEALLSQESTNVVDAEKRKDRRLADEKHSLRKQMALDESERTSIEQLKQDEKVAAEKEVYETLSKLSAPAGSGSGLSASAPSASAASKKTSKSANISVENRTSTGGAPKLLPSGSGSVPKDPKKNIFTDIDDAMMDALLREDDISWDENKKLQKDNEEEVEDNYDDDDEEVRFIPPPRSVRFPTDPAASTEADVKDVENTLVAATVDGAQAAPKSNVFNISYTPRVFPTPMRESKLAEEEDWVAKNRRHLKNHGVLGTKGGGKDVSEEDPVWLKAKADDFFRSGDFHSALNAYDAALLCDDAFQAFVNTSAGAAAAVLEQESLNDTTIKCLSNRSACYLKLGRAQQCANDCTLGLQLIQLGNAGGAAAADIDVAPAASKSSSPFDVHCIKLLARRGTCLCQLGKFIDALTDFHSALGRTQKLGGAQLSTLKGLSIESLNADIARLRLLSDTDRLKKEGDSLFADRNMDGALLKYNQSLALVPIFVSGLSNRSACKLAMGDLQGCIDDCSSAIALLEHKPDAKVFDNPFSDAQEGSHSMVLMLTHILPPVGSDRRKSWIVKTRCRRAVALQQLVTGILQKRKAGSSSNSSNSGSKDSSANNSPSKPILSIGGEKGGEGSASAANSSSATSKNESDSVLLQQLQQAIDDFSVACSIEPGNAALKTDLEKLEALKEKVALAEEQDEWVLVQ